MTKEECEKALSKLWDNTFGTDCITGEDLDKYVDIIDGLIQYVFNPQPYKFEQLETNLTVFDKALKELVLIGVMCGKHISNNTVPYFRFGDEELYTVNFEEGRFFPSTKAMEYQGKEDKND